MPVSNHTVGSNELREATYGDLEINKFLSKSTHLVVETESVFARLASCEDEVALPFLLTI
jgi:hypothetical protein